MKRERFERSWRRDYGTFSFRLLGGLLLLAWGVTMAVHGLGLNTEPAGRILDTWWPAPFALWGLVGVVERAVRGGGGVLFYLLATLLAVLLLLGNLHLGHFDGWTIFWALLVIAAAVEMLRGPRWRYLRHGRHFGIGDIDITFDGDFGRNGRVRHAGQMIGDVHLDLSQVPLPDGETPFELDMLIGDITVLVPQDLPVSVVAEATVGEVRVFGQTADGFHRRLAYETPGYAQAPRRAKIYAHLLVGDITVQQF